MPPRDSPHRFAKNTLGAGLSPADYESSAAPVRRIHLLQSARNGHARPDLPQLFARCSPWLEQLPVLRGDAPWYASSTPMAYALVLVLVGCAFHSALAGRALFRGGFLDEA
jgi:hypothetical protein